MAARPDPIIRYVIYICQSVDKADEFSSCEAQFMTCRDFAAGPGEPGLYWIGQRFDDEGRSGATLGRPAMARLRLLVEEGGIHRPYAVALDRLLRNLREALAPATSSPSCWPRCPRHSLPGSQISWG